jgi:two-component system, NtrC family, sensor kinase
MKRGSKAGGKIGRSARRKAATLKRGPAPKTVPGRRSATAAQETEIARLTRERDEALEREMATAEVLRVISSSSGELGLVFRTILESATRICEARYGIMFLCERDAFRSVAIHGSLPQAYIEEWRSGTLFRPHPDIPSARAVKTRRPAQVADMRKSSAYASGNTLAVSAVDVAGIRTVLGVPILKDDEPIGVVAIYRTEVRPFTDEQIALVQNFAAQAVIAIENARLLNELRESLQQQTATAEVLKTISRSTLELPAVLMTLVETASQHCDAYDSLIFLDEGGKLHVKAHFGPLRLDFAEWPISREWITGRAFIDRTTIHVHDPANFTKEFPDGSDMAVRLGYKAILAVPLLRENEAIGALTIRRSEAKPFTKKQIELVTTFADQAVIAIENARLLHELRQSLEQQTATSKVLDVISRSAFDLRAVFEAVAESSVRLCEADHAFIFRFDGELLRGAAFFNVSQEHNDFVERNPIRPGRHSITGRAAFERRTIHVPDISSDPEHSYAVKAIDPIRTVLAVPILKGNDLLGVISIFHLQVKPFTDNQIAVVEIFADQAAIAIENVRLLDELRQRTGDLTESLEQQTATADVLKVISRSTFNLKSVLDTLLKSAARLCQADHSFVFLREHDGYRCVSGSGDIPEWIDYLKQQLIVPGRGTAAARAVLEGRTIHIPDVLADPEYTFNEAQRRGQYRTALGVPMMREGTPVGVMVLTRPTVRPFDDGHIALVTTFADQAGIAIQNARLFEAEQQRSRELKNSLDDLRTTQDRLVQTQKLASLGQLTAGIAHEIKNPLNFVNNFSSVSAELIEELQGVIATVKVNDKTRGEIAELTDTLRDNLGKIVQHGKRADSIVKNMLLHSREGSSQHRPVDINALVDEALNLAYHGARAEKQAFNITLERSLAPDAGQVDCFPQEITRVLLNLISNGFYAANKRKEVAGDGFEPILTTTTRTLGDRVEIRIRDNGIGIPPEVRDKMFNPFFTTKPAGEGTGLGLSISHDIIVKQHSGSIEVDTRPGEFTEFRIVLPRSAPSTNRSGERA